MRVLLIQPKIRESEKAYPLGLSYVGAELKRRGHKIWGRDLSFVSLDEVCSLIDRESIDLVVASAMAYGINNIFYNFQNVLSFCRKIKDVRPLPIAIGGLYARTFKDKMLYDYKDYFDYLIIKEDEMVISELADCLDGGYPPKGVNNLIFKNNGQIIINKSSDQLLDLKQYPIPDRGIFPIFNYKGMVTRGKNYTQIITSRGCNQKCAYCPQPSLEGIWRGEPIDKVIDEIRSIVDNFGIREFHIEDENFFGGGVERIKEFCLGLINNRLNIKWQCPNGIPVFELRDSSVFKLMAKAGCYSICLGIESFDQEILQRMNRVSDFEETQKVIKSAQEAGLEVVGYLMINFPGQTKKSIINDIRISKELGLDFIYYSLFRLIPGSSVYFDYQKGLYTKNTNLSPGNLKMIRAKAYLFNCFRPKVFLFLLRSLIKIKNPFRFLRRATNHFLETDFKF
jgi:radical SAM superfamily enzyme YgiQ (UPF0313 family)